MEPPASCITMPTVKCCTKYLREKSEGWIKSNVSIKHCTIWLQAQLESKKPKIALTEKKVYFLVMHTPILCPSVTFCLYWFWFLPKNTVEHHRTMVSYCPLVGEHYVYTWWAIVVSTKYFTKPSQKHTLEESVTETTKQGKMETGLPSEMHFVVVVLLVFLWVFLLCNFVVVRWQSWSQFVCQWKC